MFLRIVSFPSLLLAVFFAFSGGSLAAPAPEEAKKMVETMANEAIATLSAPNRTPEQISETFHQILTDNFDIDGIARFVLGRYWRMASETQRAEYTPLFENYIVSIYADRFSNYSGETVSVNGAKVVGNDVIVSSLIRRANSSAPPVLVEWKISDSKDGKPRVEDVIIEQVSMSITQRSEFNSIIQNNGGSVEALLQRLRNRVR